MDGSITGGIQRKTSILTGHLSHIQNKMRNIIIFICVLYFISMEDKDFCDGFAEAYTAAYCSEVTNCVEPVIPSCPVPSPGQDSYEGGWAAGWPLGLEAKESVD